MLNKKQAKAILDLLKSKLLDTRPVLQHLCVKDHKWYATDGYVLVGGATTADDKMVNWQTLEKWCKLAGAKDLLDLNELEADECCTVDIYPDVERVLAGWTNTFVTLDLRYSPALIDKACKVLGDNPVKIIPLMDSSVSKLFFTTNLDCTAYSTAEPLWAVVMGLDK